MQRLAILIAFLISAVSIASSESPNHYWVDADEGSNDDDWEEDESWDSDDSSTHNNNDEESSSFELESSELDSNQTTPMHTLWFPAFGPRFGPPMPSMFPPSPWSRPTQPIMPSPTQPDNTIYYDNFGNRISRSEYNRRMGIREDSHHENEWEEEEEESPHRNSRNNGRSGPHSANSRDRDAVNDNIMYYDHRGNRISRAEYNRLNGTHDPAESPSPYTNSRNNSGRGHNRAPATTPTTVSVVPIGGRVPDNSPPPRPGDPAPGPLLDAGVIPPVDLPV